MDEMKISNPKRSKEELKNNNKKDAKTNQEKDLKPGKNSLKKKQSYNEDSTNQEVNQSLSEVKKKKDSKNKICNKDSDNYKLKLNEAENKNKKDFHEDIVCNSSKDDEKGFLEEIDEDIFKLSKDYSLAHCVAEDLRMGAGIAVDFKKIYGGVGKLADQQLKIGDVGIVNRHDQFVFYLITKKNSNGKPTMDSMEKALHSLLSIMKKQKLTKLGIPRLGCGLDKLDWSDTRSLIINIFSGSGIHITVCVPSKLLDSKAPSKLIRVKITPNHLWEMEAQTTIILFIDLKKVYNKNWIDDIVNKVDAKYPFKENLLKDVKKKKLVPGEIMCYNVHNEIIICMFTIQDAYYDSLEIGFKSIDRKIKYYKYMAIQSGSIESSDNFKHISWLVLILRSVIHSSELWLCGVVDQTKGMIYDQYCKNLYSSINYSFQYNSPFQKKPIKQI